MDNEERERYDWETEDGTGTAVVADAQRNPSLEERVAKLEREKQETRQFVGNTVAQLEGMADTFATAIESMSNRLNRIQDANLAPMLERSAVIVELRGIRSAIEALTKSIDGVQEANVYGQWCIRTMPFGGDS